VSGRLIVSWRPSSGTRSNRSTLHARRNPHEFLDGFELPECLRRAIEIEPYIFVNQHIAKTGQLLEGSNDHLGKLGALAQVADGAHVIIERHALPHRQLARNVDYGLTDDQERKEYVIVKRQVTLEIAARLHPRAELVQMGQVPPQIGEAVNERGHRGALPRCAGAHAR
jgi:hypothetical protein